MLQLKPRYGQTVLLKGDQMVRSPQFGVMAFTVDALFTQEGK